MKALILSIALFTSVHCFAQDTKSESEIKKEYLIKAHKSPEYKKAFIDVNEVKQNLTLAKKGLLKRTDVVKDYNLRLGEYMGEKQTFKDVELRINNDGEKFIQFILLKTASRLALEDAAEKP